MFYGEIKYTSISLFTNVNEIPNIAPVSTV